MRKFTIAICILFLTVRVQAQDAPKPIISYVNPFIGTAAHGHTYPGATLPFGMVQLSPDNGTQGWDWCSGYNYSDSFIAGFSHTHLSGTGIGDLYDVSVLPMTNVTPDTLPVHSKFSHTEEKASPGYYSVRLKDYDVQAELTTGVRSGFHRYIFPASQNSCIRINLGFAINWDKATECYIKQLNDTTFVGYRFSTGWAKNQKVFFAIRTSKIIRQTVSFVDNKKVEGTEWKGKDVKTYLMFATKQGDRVLMKVGLSMADIDGALASMTEIPDWNFEVAKTNAESIWERELRKIQIKTNDSVLKETFYTALYHTYQAPTIFTDRLGNYKGVKGDVQNSKQMLLTTQSLWDTYRAANPLLTITQTELVTNIINSYLTFYQQNGLLPVWDLHFNETNTMTGYHAVPIIADAILKGIKGFNVQLAYEAMKASAMQNIRGTDAYRKYGYLPYTTRGESVTITLEYAFDDWCIAQVARRLGKNDDYNEFMKRASSFKALFDKKTGFFRGKDSLGVFIKKFDPYALQHDGEQSEYTEGNAWQHGFYAPHEVQGLAKLHGGRDKLTLKLDSLFNTTGPVVGFVSDVTGLIGQYAQGNEPSHHIPYIYTAIGEPAKAADILRKICATQYTNKTDGLCGNEDCGQMSAWYVWTVLGFYPMNPASGEYVFGSPLMDEAALQLPDGKMLRIIAQNNSSQNKYIQKVTLNGSPYNSNFFRHGDLMNGGILTIEMGPKPSRKWGKKEDGFPK